MCAPVELDDLPRVPDRFGDVLLQFLAQVAGGQVPQVQLPAWALLVSQRQSPSFSRFALYPQ